MRSESFFTTFRLTFCETFGVCFLVSGFHSLIHFGLDFLFEIALFLADCGLLDRVSWSKR